MEDHSSMSVTSTSEKITSDKPVVSSELMLPPGSNEMLRAPLTSADDLEVIISDVIIPPNGTVPRHYHPGEEFIYIIEGSVVHVEEGMPEEIRQAGDAFVIAPEVEHEPRGTKEGARVIAFRVHDEGQPERILVEDYEHGDEIAETAGEGTDTITDFATIDLTDLADRTVEFTVSKEAGFDDTVGFYEVNEDNSVKDPILVTILLFTSLLLYSKSKCRWF